MIIIEEDRMKVVDGPGYVVEKKRNKYEKIARYGEEFECCGQKFIVENDQVFSVEYYKELRDFFDLYLDYVDVTRDSLVYNFFGQGGVRLSNGRLYINGLWLSPESLSRENMKLSYFKDRKRVKFEAFKDKFCRYDVHGWMRISNKEFLVSMFAVGDSDYSPTVQLSMPLSKHDPLKGIKERLSVDKVRIWAQIEGKRIDIVPYGFDFKIYFDLKKLMKEGNFIESDIIIPNTPVNVNGKKIYYELPTRWKSDNIVRYDNAWYHIEDTPLGKALVSKKDTILLDSIIGAGQYVPVIRMFKKYARLYNIVTPEGIFVVDVPREYLEKKSENISVFDENVKILGTMFVFPTRIYAESTGLFVNVHVSRGFHPHGFSLKLGNIKIDFGNVLSNKSFIHYLKNAGINPENLDVGGEFGLSVI